MTHLSSEQLESVILDVLDAAGTRAVAEHVRECPACAQRLKEEAAFELLLCEAAGAAPSPRAAPAPRPPPASMSSIRRRRAVRGGLALALAAGIGALLLWRGGPGGANPASELEGASLSNRGVHCAPGPTQDDCTRRARRLGLFVAYPPRAHTNYGLEAM